MYNREKKSIAHMKWVKANPEKVKGYAKKDWEKHREKRLVDHKVWVEKNREAVLRSKREWYQKVKDAPEVKAQKRNWYLTHREEILRKQKEENALKPPRVLKTKEEIQAKRKVWVDANRAKLNVLSAKYRNENLKKYQQYARGYYRESLSFKVQYSRMRRDTKVRNITLEITLEDFTEIVSKPCEYCGEEKERRGIDRKDNTLGYTKENSASACKICNYMKKTMTVQDFLYHVKKIAEHTR